MKQTLEPFTSQFELDKYLLDRQTSGLDNKIAELEAAKNKLFLKFTGKYPDYIDRISKIFDRC